MTSLTFFPVKYVCSFIQGHNTIRLSHQIFHESQSNPFSLYESLRHVHTIQSLYVIKASQNPEILQRKWLLKHALIEESGQIFITLYNFIQGIFPNHMPIYIHVYM